MNESLTTLLAELETFGARNDAANSDRARRMLNITRATGEFLSVLVRATRAKRILEIGTSNGYSTLWLASSAEYIHGRVTTVERSESKCRLAAVNFAHAELSHVIDLVADDAGAFLDRAADSAYDMIFLDSERSEYLRWWPSLRRVLDDGALLVVDNATSHRGELLDFMALVDADAQFTTSTVPVGNGEFLAVKATTGSHK